MSLQGGDREFGHGDQVTVVYDDSTDAVGGEAVYVTGRASTGDHVTVELAGNGEDPDAILSEGATQGDAVEANFHGMLWARVADGDNVSASDQVSVKAGTGDGVLTSGNDNDYRVLEGEATDNESGETIAFIRFEN